MSGGCASLGLAVGLFMPVSKRFQEFSVAAAIDAPFTLLEKPINVVLFDAIEVTLGIPFHFPPSKLVWVSLAFLAS